MIPPKANIAASDLSPTSKSDSRNLHTCLAACEDLEFLEIQRLSLYYTSRTRERGRFQILYVDDIAMILNR